MPVSSLPETKIRSPIDALAAGWQFFASGRWAALLLVLLALTMILFVLSARLAERTPTTMGDAYPNALSARTELPILAASGSPLREYVGLWLRCLFGLFAFTLGLRLADRADLLFRASRNILQVQATYGDGPPAYDGSLPDALSEAEVRARLRRGLLPWLTRIWQTTEDDKPVLYADRLRLALWGDGLMHLGCLAILLGAYITAEWSWREEQVTLTAGESYELMRAPGYALTVDTPVVAPSDGLSTQVEMTITVKSPQDNSREYQFGPFRPLLAVPFAVFHQAGGSALNISARDRNGEYLLLQPFVKGRGLKATTAATMKFGQGTSEDYLFVPRLALFLRMDRYESLPEKGYDTAVYLLRGYQNNQPAAVFSRYIQQNDSFEWDNITFEVHAVPYVLVNVVNDIGWWFVLVGLTCLAMGGLLRRAAGALWLARFEAVRQSEDLVFDRLILWPEKGLSGTDSSALRRFLRAVGVANREP